MSKLSYGISKQKELLPLLKIGKEMTLIRAKYLYEKHEIKSPSDLIELGEERLKEIFLEMLPFHEKIQFFKSTNNNPNNNHGNEMAASSSSSLMTGPKMNDSCLRLAQQIIIR